MGIGFHETPRGVRFFDRQMPDLIKAIQKNTEELKRANDLKELELRHKGVIGNDSEEKA